MLTNKDHLDMAPYGWSKLVHNLDHAISLISPNYEIIQVKEKFGMLRYYVDFSSIDDDASIKISDLITSAEKASINTCINCGSYFDNQITRRMSIVPRSVSLCQNCKEA
jgi:hypothetical protein